MIGWILLALLLGVCGLIVAAGVLQHLRRPARRYGGGGYSGGRSRYQSGGFFAWGDGGGSDGDGGGCGD